MLRCVLTVMIVLVLASTACAPAAPATLQVPPVILPTETPLATQSPAPSPIPTATATPVPTETLTPEPTSTDTPVPLLPSTATSRPKKKKTSINPSPTDMATATFTSSSMATETFTPSSVDTPTFCPPPTPEPLWVEPVISPTGQLSQVITVRVGYGTEVTISSESGVFTVTGSFNTFANPALVDIALLPNTAHHLDVTAKIQPPAGNDCTYDSYSLHTTLDRNGAPLVIVQGAP